MTQEVPPPAPAPGRRRLPLMPLFFGTGIIFFGLAILDRFAAAAASFANLLLIIFLAWFLAFLMGPVVDAFHQRVSRISRALAATTVYGVVLAVLIGLVWLAAQVGAPEAADLLGRGNEASRNVQTLLHNLQDGLGLGRNVVDLAASLANAQQSFFPALTSSLNAQFQAIASTLVIVVANLFLVVILSLYAVIDTDSLLRALKRLVPKERAEELDLVQRTVARAFRGFLSAQLLMMAFQVLLTLAVGLFFGLPYLFLISSLTALAMFIPFVGPLVALVLPIAVAVAFRPEVALPVALILFVTQTLVINLVLPRLVHRSIGLHPILVLLVLLLGFQVAGVWGAFFGIPLAAVASILISYALNKRAVLLAEGIDLEEVAAELRLDDPEIPIEEAAAVAAARIEDSLVPDQEPKLPKRRRPWSRRRRSL